jgi:hypothetical protein
MVYLKDIFSILLVSLSIQSVSAKRGVQKPIMDNIGPVIPPTDSEGPPPTSPGVDVVILSDVLGRDRSINVFAGFTRSIDSVDERLSNGGKNTTVLAPLNSAITSLPRKPWESNDDYNKLGADAYEGKSGEDRAHANLRLFVEEHIVPESPWVEGTKLNTVAGTQVWWENKNGKKIVGIVISLFLN